jgi:hypothetical protein
MSWRVGEMKASVFTAFQSPFHYAGTSRRDNRKIHPVYATASRNTVFFAFHASP